MKKWIWVLVLFAAVGGFAYLQGRSDTVSHTSTILDPKQSVKTASAVKSVASYVATRAPGTLYNNLKLTDTNAVDILAGSTDFAEIVSPALAQNHLIEVFGVYDPKAGDLAAPCTGCKRVEMYDFTDNTSYIALVSPAAVASLSAFKDLQPDIPPHLIAIANDIIAAYPEVLHEMEEYSIAKDAKTEMPNTKTTIKQTRCERNRHLCVAPTYPTKDGALWTIVDLTDLYLAAIAWTSYPADQPDQPVTLKRLEFDKVDSEYCQKSHHFDQQDWSGDYALTSSDGLMIANLTYKGERLAESIKLVDWHVNYSTHDNFGYADAVGCPAFSQAAVVAAQPPTIDPLDDSLGKGFALNQQFWSDGWPGPCNYFYTQRLNMYADGSFKVLAESDGRGCGNDGTYRPIIRVKLSKGQSGVGINKEKQWLASTDPSEIFAKSANYQLTSSRKDNAVIYLTEGVGKDEGDSEIPTIGGCCSTDFAQGPDQFVNNEDLSGNSTVLWYVGQMKNSDAVGQEYCWARSVVDAAGKSTNQVYPCSAGPYFKRIK
jgi:hypothetical protein